MKPKKVLSDTDITASLEKLRVYIEGQDFKGYDPYDTLTSFLPLKAFGKFPAAVATQIQKRNPINIRPLLGIRKDYNPKGIGLLLHAYVRMQELFPQSDYSNQIGFLFNWLLENASKEFSGPCWGYNFGWASPEKYLHPHAPTVVATAFIAQGLHAYYLFSGNEKAKDLLCDIAPFILKDVPVTHFKEGICYSYSPFMEDCCYNASLLAAETLARIYSITKENTLKEMACKAVDFVVSKQHADGHWEYKLDPVTGLERHQVDFHQGYILDSIQFIGRFTGDVHADWIEARKKGLRFYMKQQFFSDGRSLWRLPKEYPVEIHNQSQGIISLSRSANDVDEGLDFAGVIAAWTIREMQDSKKGYFYYRKLKYYTNKLSYMRWSNAWMLLALTEILQARKTNNIPDHA